MDAETMRRALDLANNAQQLLKKHNEYVLLKVDQASSAEFINVGDPVQFRKDEYHRMKVPIPAEARRYVFALWKREIALKYNAIVRELNQIGMSHSFELLPITRPTHDHN